MLRQSNAQLSDANTFGFECIADHLIRIDSIAELCVLRDDGQPLDLVLGGGSNLLLPEHFHGTVVQPALKGIRVVEQTERDISIQVAAGEVWHELVLWSVQRGYWGLENLALIPGHVGAAPIQNIGAYGVEIGGLIQSVEWLDWRSGQVAMLAAEDCCFGYRDSIFKHELKNRGVVTAIQLHLSKVPQPVLNYAPLDLLAGQAELSARQVADCVIATRRSRLPDPRVLGNAGSFFKNPVLGAAQFAALRQRFPQLRGYEVENGWKVAAGWLIEHAGFKGLRSGHVGVYEQQALVLVHFGAGKAEEIRCLAQRITAEVRRMFGVMLEVEVNILESNRGS